MLYYYSIRTLIYATPFIDAFNGLAMSIGAPVIFGQIIRLPIILAMMVLLIKINFKCFVISLAVFLFYICRDILLYNWVVADVVVSITATFRYFYVLIFFLLILSAYKKSYITSRDLLKWSKKAILVFAIIILVSKFSGIGLKYAGASKGLFIEVNALTALLVYGVSIWLYPLYFERFSKYDLCGALAVVLATGSQATKTGLLGVIVVLIYYACLSVVKKKNVKILMITLLILILGGLGIYAYLMSEIGMEVLSRWQFFLDKMDLFTFLVSGRNVALQVAFEEWISNSFYIMFGTGWAVGAKLTFWQNPTLAYGGPEMDIFDIGFYYGCIAMSFIGYWLVKPIMKYYKEKDYIHFSYVLFFVVMFFGGHVLSSPMAGIFFSIAYVLASNNDNIEHVDGNMKKINILIG